jgi:hypothetical protein
MNNPLNRAMFRQAGMSKQPMGILASSPELMTTAQKAMMSGQPVTANNGRANFISTAPTVGFGSKNQPYIPLNKQVTNPNLPTVRNVNQEKRDLYKAKPSGFSKKNSGIQTVGTSNLSTDNSLLSQYMNKESPLSAFGDEGREIDKAVSTPLFHSLAGKNFFDKAGDKARAYYEAKSKGNQDMEGGDTSVQKSNVDAYAINSSNKNILNNALIMVDQEKMRKQKLEKESVIQEEIGMSGELKIPKGYGNVIKSKKTEEDKLKNKTGKREDFLKNVPQIVTDKSSEKKGSGIEKKGSGNTKTDDVKVKNDKMIKLLSGSIAENKTVESNETILKANGYSDNDIKEMSLKDQAIETRALITELYGKKDMGLDDDLESMNLIMLGLSIAAGTSPDALQNIANGGKDYIKRRTDQIKEKKKVNKELDMLTLKTVLADKVKEKDFKQQDKILASSQKHDMRKISVMNKNDLVKFGMDMDFKLALTDYNNDHNMNIAIFNNENATDRFNVKLKADANNLVASLDNALTISQNNNESADNRAKAANEAAELRSVIGNLDKGYGFALIQGKNEGKEGDELIKYVQSEGKKFAKNPYLTGPDSLRRLIINNAGVVMKEQQISFKEATDLIFNTIDGSPDLKKFFPEIDINNMQKKLDSQIKKPINLTSNQ